MIFVSAQRNFEEKAGKSVYYERDKFKKLTCCKSALNFATNHNEVASEVVFNPITKAHDMLSLFASFVETWTEIPNDPFSNEKETKLLSVHHEKASDRIGNL